MPPDRACCCKVLRRIMLWLSPPPRIAATFAGIGPIGLAPASKIETIQDMSNDCPITPAANPPVPHPFRRAVVRGLAVLCPPLLTILILVWVVGTTKTYFLEPVTHWARESIVWYVADIREDLPLKSPAAKTTLWEGKTYSRLENGAFIPEEVYELVEQHPVAPQPTTGEEFYRRYVDLTFLRPWVAIPFFLSMFTLLLYFLGKFMAAGMGNFFVNVLDMFIAKLPGVRSVYSAIKQVSDFIFTEREMKFTRIVAVEYPRKGIWSMGFVTGEGLASIRDSVGEPILSVLIPYSPLPVTGTTILVRKSECIDLNVSFDQACQFIVSCGVVIPPQQIGNNAKPK
jgi:uncharacterized membrane protein